MHVGENPQVALIITKKKLVKATDLLLRDAKELEGLRKKQQMLQIELREASVKSCSAHSAGR